MSVKKQGRPPGRPKTSINDKPTKDIILQKATVLFLRDGYTMVSVDDIAKVAGMTKASVYYYFDSKAELFKETMVRLMKRIREHIVDLLSSDKPLKERLYDVILAHLRATTTFDLEGFMRESRTSLTPEQIQEIKMAEEEMFVSIQQTLDKAILNGEIRSVNTRFAAHSYIALATVGNYKQEDGSLFFSTPKETANQILHVFWRGFFEEKM
jgi:AcrR family transcriptional regulator